MVNMFTRSMAGRNLGSCSAQSHARPKGAYASQKYQSLRHDLWRGDQPLSRTRSFYHIYTSAFQTHSPSKYVLNTFAPSNSPTLKSLSTTIKFAIFPT